MRVIGYGSRKLNRKDCKSQKSKLKFLTMKWTMGSQFNKYFYYAKHVDVFTNYNLLTHLKTMVSIKCSRVTMGQ